MPSPEISHEDALWKLEVLKQHVTSNDVTPTTAVWMTSPIHGSRYFRDAVVFEDDEWFYLVTEHHGCDVYFKDEWDAIQLKEQLNLPSVDNFIES